MLKTCCHQAHCLQLDLHNDVLAYFDTQGLATKVGIKSDLAVARDAGLACSAWDMSPHTLDFGWGPPIWFQTMRRVSLQYIFLLLSDMHGDGTWVWGTLPDEDYLELEAAGGFPAVTA